MDSLDQHYLTLQFWHKVFRTSGAEFQRFCEDIFLKAFPDFKTVKPHGRYGDGGNDGFRASAGIYYQMYAPEMPQMKGLKAAEKLKSDFEKLKENWDSISPIKSYFFVFNDKGNGTSIIIENALSELREDNPGIDFASFLVADLERTFFGLDPASILGLGFNIDSTKAVAQAREYLEVVETYLDRENGAFAEKVLASATKVVSDLQDDELSLAYEILVCRILHKQEKHSEAIEKYEDLCRKHPDDPRPFLYLAELHLSHDDEDLNAELIEQAESINAGHWLVKLEKLVRDLHCGNEYDTSKIDERMFPSDPRVKSSYYRLFAVVLANSGQHAKTESFIERAIELNPDRLLNYFVKFLLLKGHVFSGMADKERFRKGLDDLLVAIRSIEDRTAEWEDISPRTQATININRIDVAYHQGNIAELERLAKPTFEQLNRCCFDHSIDCLFVVLLMRTVWPPSDFQKLLTHLRGAGIKAPSEDLTHAILFQFFLKKSVLTEGKEFFAAVERPDMLSLIDTLEEKRYDDTWALLKDNLNLAVMIAGAAKDFPELRHKIIQNLPDDGRIQKEKLRLLLDYDENNMDDAFGLLKGLDLSDLNVIECATVLEIARTKEAWDFVVVIVEKLLQHETDKRARLQLRLQLYDAQFRLDKFSEAAQTGESILSSSDDLALLDEYNREGLLGQTISARSARGENKQAKTLLEAHRDIPKTFEFKLAVEAQVYLRNNEPKNALASVLDAVRIQGYPTPEQYGELFPLFAIIGNLIELPLTSLESVEVSAFVKLVEQERWYHIGNDDTLDATALSSAHPLYGKFLGKQVGEKVVMDDTYSSKVNEYTLELIMPIERYVCWQASHHAQRLTREHRWDKMEMIEIPSTGESADPKYLIARLEEDNKKHSEFFDLYCEGKVPLAFLAVSRGGLTGAIGSIVNENRGFIECCSGDKAMIYQKAVAKKLITGDAFFIDGTSALVLSETGLLANIFEYLPNLRVPQSVITFLLETKDRFKVMPGQVGFLRCSQEKLSISRVDEKTGEAVRKNFQDCISLLESKPHNIIAISNANKADCFSEQTIPPSLCDACILAQGHSISVVTEDYRYLQADQLETGKRLPEYCSTIALISALYEEGKVTFDQYLEFFYYLTSYRFRFLPVSATDIEKAVLGDGAIRVVRPDRVRLFNFPLTLSEEYGVPFDSAFSVVGHFLVRVLIDDLVMPVMADKIFGEILTAFPTNMEKRSFGRMLIGTCIQVINDKRQTIIVGTRVQEKADSLSRYNEGFGGGSIQLS